MRFHPNEPCRYPHKRHRGYLEIWRRAFGCANALFRNEDRIFGLGGRSPSLGSPPLARRGCLGERMPLERVPSSVQ